MKIEFEELTLQTLGGEHVSARFQHELARLVDDLMDPDCSRSGMAKGKLLIEAEFSFAQDSQALTYGVKVVRKSPTPRARGQVLQVIDGVVMAQREENAQTTLDFKLVQNDDK